MRRKKAPSKQIILAWSSFLCLRLPFEAPPSFVVASCSLL